MVLDCAVHSTLTFSLCALRRQRNAWIGHVCCGAEEAGASEEFRTRLADWLAANIGVYAPFLDEGTGALVD